MVQDLQQIHDEVQHMIEELQEASVHLERALFARNRLTQWLGNDTINQEFNEHLKPPEVAGERRWSNIFQAAGKAVIVKE